MSTTTSSSILSSRSRTPGNTFGTFLFSSDLYLNRFRLTIPQIKIIVHCSLSFLGTRKHSGLYLESGNLHPGDIWRRAPVSELLRVLHLLPGRDHGVQALHLPPGPPGEHGLLHRDSKGIRDTGNVPGIDLSSRGYKFSYTFLVNKPIY